jgi:hypothetical protein
MDPAQVNPRSFVLKIWLDADAANAGLQARRLSWHGYVTDVSTGEKQYVRSVGDLLTFFVARLNVMNAEVNPVWRVVCRMRRRASK